MASGKTDGGTDARGSGLLCSATPGVHLLSEAKGDALVNRANVWPMIKRLDSTFDPKDHGYGSFSEMLKALDAAVEVKKGETDHLLRLR